MQSDKQKQGNVSPKRQVRSLLLQAGQVAVLSYFFSDCPL